VLERFNRLTNNILIYNYDTEESQEYDNSYHNDTENDNEKKIGQILIKKREN
jgi:hypothetical protein